jgi:heme-degrading monooxygenase HmoA
MTTIGMNYEVIPGKEAEFEKGFLAVLEKLKEVPGHVESKMYSDVATKGSYMIWSRWESKDQFQAFLLSPTFAQVTAWGRAEMLRARPKHNVYSDV